MNWLPTLTPGQGSMMSGLFTAVGAVFGIFVASYFFSGRVKTLKDALDESQNLVQRYAADVRSALAEVTASIELLSGQASSLQTGVTRIEADLVEQAEQVELIPASEPRERLRQDWLFIRDELEKRASSETVDGRTRAAFGRVDRRSYYDLIRKMEESGTLSAHDARTSRKAYELWQRHKNGKTSPSDSDLASMAGMKQKVIPA